MNFFRSRWKTSLAAGVVSAIVTATVLYLHVQRTQAALQRLRQANDERSLRLLQPAPPAERPVVTRLPVQAPAPLSLPPRAAPAPMPGVYREEGQATPVATLQTFAWACDQGDVATVARLLTFEAGGRARVAAYLAQLPAPQRARWASPEELAATVCIGGFLRAPYPPADAIALATLETVSADRVRLRLPGTVLDGGQYQKTSDGWKFLIPDATVDERLKALAQASAASVR